MTKQQNENRQSADVEVREIPKSEKQAEALYQIAKAGYGKNFTWSRAQFIESLFSPFTVYLGLFEDKHCVGFLCFHEVAGDMEIHHLVLLPEKRRKGYAGRLLSEMTHRMSSRNSGPVFLEVRESNEPARRLYRQFGFKEAGIRKKYYDSPLEDAIIMKFVKKGETKKAYE